METENTSNTQSESFPEKVDACVGSSAGNAMIERVSGQESALKRSGPEEDSKDSVSTTSRPTKRPRPAESDDDEEEFKIPERFSKNGRKKAVSFPLKVKIQIVFQIFLVMSFRYSNAHEYPPRSANVANEDSFY